MKKIIIFLINIYIKFISPVFVVVLGHSCRFSPSCSVYTKEAIVKFGVKNGTVLAIKRLIKCQPFGSSGYDPLPESLGL